MKTRHSAQSLKQKVDLLELQVQDLKKKLDTTKNVVRRNYLEFKYAIPPQFSDTLESIMDLLESIEDAGGLASLIQRIQLSTPRSLPTNLLHFNKDGEIPDKIIDAIAAKLQAHTGMPSKAEVNGLQDKIQRIENNAVTFKDLEDMYRPPEEHKTIINNHITNINNYGDSRRNSEAVPYTQSTIESSPNSTDQQAVDTSDSESQAVPRRRKSLISENYARLLKIIAVTADQQIKKAEKEKADDKAKKGAINTESKDLDTIVEEIKKYTDDKVRNANLQLKMGFDALQYKVDSKAAKAELDFIVLQDKLKEQVKAIKDHWEKSRDTANKRDSELLRELEMKVANMSFDKVSDTFSQDFSAD